VFKDLKKYVFRIVLNVIFVSLSEYFPIIKCL
jgi:uncharacterized membrane protein YagU involved in acid resistance